MATLPILVIDDDDEVAAAIRTFLEFCGHSVFVASCGELGLAMARDSRPGLIMLDWQMPHRMSGIQVLNALNSDDTLRDIPVIVMSAQAQPISPEILGKHLYLSKPFNGDTMVELVKQELRHTNC